jgi:6-phosphogluconolactonase (cycloisomerase 2 family)
VGDIVVAPSADFVYVNNDVAGASSVSAFSVGAGGALTPVPGSPFQTGGRGTGGGFFATNRITVCAVGNFLYASNAGSNDVSAFAINPATGVLTAVPGSPFATGGTNDRGIGLAATPNNQFLYAMNSGSNNVTIFSIGSNGALTRVGAPVALNLQPDGEKVSPDGRFLVVAAPQTAGGVVGVLGIAANGALTPVPGSPFPDGGAGISAGIDINCASNRVFAGYAASQTQVGVFNLAANGSLSHIAGSPFTFASGANSNVALLNPNENLLFVSNQVSNTITVLNVAANGTLTLAQGSPFANPGGNQPSGMATNRAGTFLYAVNFNNTVSVFRVEADGKLTPVTGSPFNTGQQSGQPLSLTAFPAKTCNVNLSRQ